MIKVKGLLTFKLITIYLKANGGLDKLISAAREIIDVVLNSDIKVGIL